MKTKKRVKRHILSTTEQFERLAENKATAPGLEETYHLRLYIAGMTDRSRMALKNIKKICEEQLQGKYELEVVDVYQQPEAGREQQIIAVPTLVKQLPLPIRRLLGDLSDEEKVIISLDISRPSEKKK